MSGLLAGIKNSSAPISLKAFRTETQFWLASLSCIQSLDFSLLAFWASRGTSYCNKSLDIVAIKFFILFALHNPYPWVIATKSFTVFPPLPSLCPLAVQPWHILRPFAPYRPTGQSSLIKRVCFVLKINPVQIGRYLFAPNIFRIVLLRASCKLATFLEPIQWRQQSLSHN